VRFLRHDRGHAVVALIGYSWGTILASRFVIAHPYAVNRMILFAPIYATHNPRWVGHLGVPEYPAGGGSGISPYCWTTVGELRARWDSEIPTENKTAWRANGVLTAVIEAALRSDPLSFTRTPPAFRSPTGCRVDLFRAFSGHAAFAAESIQIPILLARGDSDTTSTEPDAQLLLERLGSREKRSITTPSATHFACFEHSASLLFDALLAFL
jgi:pimeloyl-ACP methyl ester carboxylesterase